MMAPLSLCSAPSSKWLFVVPLPAPSLVEWLTNLPFADAEKIALRTTQQCKHLISTRMKKAGFKSNNLISTESCKVEAPKYAKLCVR